MKKRLLALIMAATMAVTVMVGCGEKKPDDVGSKATSSQAESSQPEEDTSSKAEESSEPAEDTSSKTEETSKTEGTESKYLSWTYKEYEAASEEEQMEAIIAVTIYTSNAMGIELTEDMLRASMETDTVKQQLETSKEQIETSMKAVPDKTFKEVLDMGLALLNDDE